MPLLGRRLARRSVFDQGRKGVRRSMVNNQQTRLSGRARLLFLTLLAVVLIVIAGLFALLSSALPAPVPQEERLSALAILTVIWLGIATASGLLAVTIIRS